MPAALGGIGADVKDDANAITTSYGLGVNEAAEAIDEVNNG